MSDKSDLSSQLFCPLRLKTESCQPISLSASLSLTDGDFGLERDHLKTVLTAPMRRLQQKTQVFPLDVKSSARSRLTHSLETAEYARILVHFLCAHRRFAPLEHPMALCVSTASLLHDLGNPPFGHFGEDVIRHCLTELTSRCDTGLTDGEKSDLRAFNGNAQGLRIVHSIQCLNLSLGQLSAMIKVPHTAPELKRYGQDPRHAGIFMAEKEILEAVRNTWPDRERHPLSFVMELCDDLAYSLADLEDGTDKGLVSESALYQLITELCSILSLKIGDFVSSPQAFAAAYRQSRGAVVQTLREVVSGLYLRQCAAQLEAHADVWLASGSVPVDDLTAVKAVAALKRFELKEIYANLEVESLELAGASYLRYLLQVYGELTQVSAAEFKRLLSREGGDAYCRRLCHRISRRHLQAYQRAAQLQPEHELYYRLHLIVDYISGMTDTYAGAEYRLLSAGIKQ